MLVEARAGERVELQVELACNGLFGQQDAHRSSSTAASSRASMRTRGGSTTTSRLLRALELDDGARPERGRASSRARAQPLLQRARPADPRGALRAPQRDARARARGDRPRAPRHGVALAARRDLPQGRAHVRDASCATWTSTPSTASRARRRSSTRGSRSASRSCGSGSAPRSTPGSSSRSAGAGSSRTATSLGRVARAPVPARPALLRARASAAAAREFWNPDVFGYNGQLPQLMREAGITRFLTQKLSWNRFNQPEHHTFIWQGDRRQRGARALPAGRHLQRRGDRAELRARARAIQGSRAIATSLLVFGHGDGGGGPTRAMLETLRRAARPPGPAAHADRDERRSSSTRSRPRPRAARRRRRAVLRVPPRRLHVAGADEARQPARASSALHDAEFLARGRGGEYPRAELDRLWKLLLLQQFHDILPGSSIAARLRGRRARPGRGRGRR